MTVGMDGRDRWQALSDAFGLLQHDLPDLHRMVERGPEYLSR